MLAPAIRALVSRRTSRSTSKSFLVEVQNHIQHNLDSRLQPYKRGTIVAQGNTGNRVTLSGTGETAADGHNYPVLLHYTTATVGADGGPAIGDNVLILHTSDGNPVVIGKVIPG